MIGENTIAMNRDNKNGTTIDEAAFSPAIAIVNADKTITTLDALEKPV